MAGLDIWFREDIKNIIMAADQANSEALTAGLGFADPELQGAYMHGFRAALRTLALAFGLAPLPLQDVDGWELQKPPELIEGGKHE